MRGWQGVSAAIAGVTLVSTVMVLPGCGELDIVDHEPLLAYPPGNVESALERCGPLPFDIEGIEGLHTAWAVDAKPVKDRNPTFQVSTATMILRLSDEGVECDEPLVPDTLTCPEGWAADIALRQAEPSPGRYLLEGISQGFALTSVWREGTECTGEVVEGSFGAQGQLEIYTVTDDCVVGRLIDTAEPLGESGAEVEGGFVALRCDAEQ